MRLVVVEYENDKHGSMDCAFCEEDKQNENNTRAVFYEESQGGVMNVCPEHLDSMVSAALERHGKAMKEGDPFWYLEADDDPWEDCE